MDVIIVLWLVCVGCRIKLFVDRYEKGWKALVPFYNKYILGKTINEVKCGKLTALTNFLFITAFWICVGVEWAIWSSLPSEIVDIENFNINDYVSTSLLTSDVVCKVILLITAILYYVSWVILTYKFSDKQGTSTWWMVGWGICPLLPYIYYAFIYKPVYLPSKGLVEYQKIEVKIKS